MPQKTISFIGAGKVTQVLGRLMAGLSDFQIGGIYSRSIESAQRAHDFINVGKVCSSISDLPSSDIIFINTSDSQIEAACQELVEKNKNQAAGFALLHCCGSQPSTILKAGQIHLGARIGSIHPIFGFSNPRQAIIDFPGTLCSFEGDTSLFPEISELFVKIGAAQVFQIETENKAAYHVAGAFPGSLTVALAKISKDLYTKAGIPSELAAVIAARLLSTTAKNTLASPETMTFNGPLPRGDLETLNRHLKVLSPTPYLSIYCELTKILLEEIQDPNFVSIVERLLKESVDIPHF